MVAGVATRSRPAASLLHDLLLQTLHEPHDFGLLPRGDSEVVERSVDVTQEALPVTLVDPEAAVGHLHVASDVIEWTAGGGAQEVDQELFLAAYAVFTPMLPEATELRVGDQPRQQIVGNGGDRVVTSQALVESLGHVVLLAWDARQRAASIAASAGFYARISPARIITMRRSSRLRWPAPVVSSTASPMLMRWVAWAGTAAPVLGPASSAVTSSSGLLS